MWEKTKGFLAVTGRDAAAARGLGRPCLCLYYRIGDRGALQRAQLDQSGRGGLMGIFEGAGLTAAQPDRLARDIQAECNRRGYEGVVLDLSPPAEALPALEALCGALERLQLRYFLPEDLAHLGKTARAIAPAAVSGGSFDQMLDALLERWGPQRLALDVVRCRSDFAMPSYEPDGTPLTAAQFREILDTYRPQSFFDSRLCCKYCTYRKQNGSAHFVLFDDPQTAAAKLQKIAEKGVGTVFLLYSEWGAEAKGLLG